MSRNQSPRSIRARRFRVRSTGRRLIWAIGVLALTLVLGAGLLPGGLELVIRPISGGDPLLIAPLEPGERFTLRYIHSVDHTPIWEEHSVDQRGNIHIEEERFVMFGAGMGHREGHGTLTTRGRYQVIQGIHQPIGDFILRIGSREVDHTIIWRGRELHLSRLAAGKAVKVSVRRTSLLPHLWQRLGIADCGSRTEGLEDVK